MSRRAELEQRLGRIAEIADVLAAMKTMALIETRKFARFILHQQRLTAGIEAAAADFLAFHPGLRRGATETPAAGELLVVIGSERGFCGDFNEAVATALTAIPPPGPRFIVVGRRLAARMEEHPRLIEWREGPTVAEEVQPVLDGLLRRLQTLAAETDGGGRLRVLAHDPDGGVATHAVLPLAPPEGPRHAHPPRLNLPPAAFFAGITEQYLLAKLPGLFYGSLMAENRRRLEHMERALKRMESKIDELRRRRNALRQEEITEEIEVILLSAEGLMDEAGE